MALLVESTGSHVVTELGERGHTLSLQTRVFRSEVAAPFCVTRVVAVVGTEDGFREEVLRVVKVSRHTRSAILRSRLNNERWSWRAAGDSTVLRTHRCHQSADQSRAFRMAEQLVQEPLLVDDPATRLERFPQRLVPRRRTGI